MMIFIPRVKLAVVFLSLLFLSIYSSYAQQKYLPGYVITSAMDTIHGLIDYRNWDKNPKSVSFKKTDTDTKTIYTVSEINEFFVNNEMYERAIVKSEISNQKSGQLQNISELIIKLDTVFLMILVRGEKSLFYFKNPEGNELFYIQNTGSIDLLEYKKFIKQERSGSRVAEVKRYTGQLSLYLHECVSIQQKLKNTSYNKKSLLKLFKHYYECTGTNAQFQKEPDSTHFEIGALAGVSLSSFSFSCTEFKTYDYLVYGNFSNSTNLTAGLFFDLIFNRTAQKMSFYNDLILTSYTTEGSYSGTSGSVVKIYNTYNTKLGATSIKLNSLLRYKYPIGKIYCYLNLGITNDWAIDQTNYMQVASTSIIDTTTEELKALNDIKTHSFGYVAGIGIKYKRYSFETRYEIASGFSIYSNLSSSIYRWYFLLGYKF
jgi:hypothetical protein